MRRPWIVKLGSWTEFQPDRTDLVFDHDHCPVCGTPNTPGRHVRAVITGTQVSPAMHPACALEAAGTCPHFRAVEGAVAYLMQDGVTTLGAPLSRWALVAMVGAP